MATTKKETAATEAAGDGRVVEYGGNTYTLPPQQPSPKAVEYLAMWLVEDKDLALVLYIREMLGQAQWDTWAERHTTNELVDLMRAIDGVLAPN